MDTSKIAVNLFTLRDHVKDAPALAGTIKRLKAIGYPSVQVSAVGPIDPKEIASILDGEGVSCCITHEKSDVLLDNPESLIERLITLKCTQTAFPNPGGIPLQTLDDVVGLARRLNRSGEILAKAGIRLSYHNHNGEFRHVGGRCILETIYAETDPKFLAAELDTYWVQAGGGSVVDWCRKLTGRLPVLHVKDYGLTNDCTPVFKEVGYGNLAWTSVLKTALEAGTEWICVEQDAHWHNGDPFESVRMSFEYLRNLDI